MKKKLWSLSLSLCALVLESCATQPPNIPVCLELGPDRGYCVRAIDGSQFIVDDTHPFDEYGQKYTWWESRPIMLHLPPSSWAAIKIFINKLCKKYESVCQEGLGSWDHTINLVDQELIKSGAWSPE